MKNRLLIRYRRRERGQTMIFVAISIVSLLAMAALAVDIVTLYLARSEIQRAADAAALAAAKAIADSGVTSLQAGDPQLGAAQTLAQNMANASINAIIAPPNNQVAGGPAATASAPSFDFTTHPGSYQVTVSLRRASLPTFFSKIWSRSSATVTATATAEAYNPTNLPTFTPISPRSVKPWLVANADPTNAGRPFITVGSGVVEQNVIGKQFDLTAGCSGAPCVFFPGAPTARVATLRVDYLPMQVTANPKNVCPTTCIGATDFEQSIECADVNPASAPSCGGGANAIWDKTIDPGAGGTAGASAQGAECLIHASAALGGQGQDSISDPLGWPAGPFQIQAGSNNPQAASGTLISTSTSIATIPIIDSPAAPPGGGAVTILGYMQAFVNWVEDGSRPNTTAGDINITVLNIAGCSSSQNPWSPVVGVSGTSPIPVRLITSP